MKNERYALTILCILALAWAVRIVTGVVGLARHQEVPWMAAGFELGMFLGAAAIPLIAPAITRGIWRIVLFSAWVPCITYVVFLSVNLATNDLVRGGLRFVLWTAITVLFVRVLLKLKPPSPTRR
jgi:hypothetical protein